MAESCRNDTDCSSWCVYEVNLHYSLLLKWICAGATISPATLIVVCSVLYTHDGEHGDFICFAIVLSLVLTPITGKVGSSTWREGSAVVSMHNRAREQCSLAMDTVFGGSVDFVLWARSSGCFGAPGSATVRQQRRTRQGL